MKETMKYVLVGAGIITLGIVTYIILEKSEEEMLAMARGNAMIDAILAKANTKKQRIHTNLHEVEI